MIEPYVFEPIAFGQPRAENTHKGDYGRIAVIAGSVKMPGAACLCAHAALKSGAGLVTVMSVAPLFPMLTIQYPELMGEPLPCDDKGGWTEASITTSIEMLQAKRIDQVVIGPGLGQGPVIAELVRTVLAWCEEKAVPCVCDADALNMWPIQNWSKRQTPTIITPHPKEFERWVQDREYEPDEDSMAQLSEDYGLIVVYKTHRSRVIQNPRSYINTTGNPGMATAGSGDVLAGMIASFVAQWPNAFEATVAAVNCHGEAGDLCYQSNGVAFTARDLILNIPHAMTSLKR